MRNQLTKSKLEDLIIKHLVSGVMKYPYHGRINRINRQVEEYSVTHNHCLKKAQSRKYPDQMNSTYVI